MRSDPALWALVLAGGNGTRLQPLTRLLTGAPIPKQYCRIAGERSLLEETLARVGGLVPPRRTLVIVNRDHLALATPQLAGVPAANVVVQPGDRDTGPGVLLPILTLARRDPNAMIAIFPSDHYVGEVGAFRGYVRRAAALAAADSGKLVLLGADPEWADPGYGYILPGAAVGARRDADAFHVRAFCEKPPPPIAARIVERGGLWNCFVIVCRARRLLELARATRPRDVARLAAAADAAATAEAAASIDGSAATADAYAALAPWNFSADLLAHATAHLVVVRARAMRWSDWGTVDAIERTLFALGRTPPWHATAAPRHVA